MLNPTLKNKRKLKKIKTNPETKAKVSLYSLKKFPKKPAIKPNIVNAANNPSEKALVMSTAFFLSLNATEKNAGSNAIPQGEVIEMSPAKNARKKVMLKANCCSYCLSL